MYWQRNKKNILIVSKFKADLSVINKSNLYHIRSILIGNLGIH